MKTSEARLLITKTIIDSLKRGVKPWSKGWSNCPNTLGLAKSLSSGQNYRGVNQWILQAISGQRNYRSCWFGTFNQIKQNGGSIKKGSKSIQVCFYKPLKRERVDKNGNVKDESFMMMKFFRVFCVEQTTNLDHLQAGFAQSSEPNFERFEIADRLFDATGAVIRKGSNSAYYNPTDDFITMPFESQFESRNHWYGTLCHEFIHWSEKRIGLDRSKIDESYAFCELVAEMGSTFLLNHFGIESTVNENSTAYIEGWLKKLKGDVNYIFKASSWASKAVDYLLSFSPEGATTDQVTEEIPF